MEAVSLSETPLSIYQMTWYHIPEDCNVVTHCPECFKFLILMHIFQLRLYTCQFFNKILLKNHTLIYRGELFVSKLLGSQITYTFFHLNILIYIEAFFCEGTLLLTLQFPSWRRFIIHWNPCVNVSCRLIKQPGNCHHNEYICTDTPLWNLKIHHCVQKSLLLQFIQFTAYYF
jgi:hypothetical protein